MSDVEDIVRIPGEWNIPYQYAAGATAARFFRELRDARRILGTRCHVCKRVLVPPRPFCERDFVAIDDWVEVGPEGRVETFTVTFERFAGLPDPPFAIALIRLDGASTSLAHFLSGVSVSNPQELFERVRSGLRVKAVFREERHGSILDIKWFEPVSAE